MFKEFEVTLFRIDYDGVTLVIVNQDEVWSNLMLDSEGWGEVEVREDVEYEI